MMKLTIALILASLPTSVLYAEIYNYACKVDGKTYPLRVDDNKDILEWMGQKYSLTPVANPDVCGKSGWYAKGNGTAFTFCTFTKGGAAIVDKDGNEQADCNVKSVKR